MEKIKKTKTVIVSIAVHSLESVVANFFEGEGYNVVVVKNYYEVIRQSSKRNVKYIVIGGVIENHTGISVAKRIKSFDNENKKKIILINVNLMTNLEEKELEKDNIYILHLPFENSDLKHIIDKHRRNPLARKKIICVGENESDREYMSRLKTKYKLGLKHVDNFSEIEDMHIQADAIIVDCETDLDSKLAGIKLLRENEDYKLIPIIAINNTLKNDHYIDYGVSGSYTSVNEKAMLDSMRAYFDKNVLSKKYILAISSNNLVNAYINFIVSSMGLNIKFISDKKEYDACMKNKSNVNMIIIDFDDNSFAHSYASIIKQYNPSGEHALVILVHKDEFLKIKEEYSTSIDFIEKPFESTALTKIIKANTMTKRTVSNLQYQNHLLETTNKNNMAMLSYAVSGLMTPTILIANYAKNMEKSNEAKIIHRQSLILQRTIDVLVDYYAMENGDIVLEKTYENIIDIFKSILDTNHEILGLKNIRYSVDIKDEIKTISVDRVIMEKVFSALILYIFNMSVTKYKVSFSFSNIDYTEEDDTFLDLFQISQKIANPNLEISLSLKTDKFVSENLHDDMFYFTLNMAERFLELHNGHLYKHKKDDYEHIVLLIPYE